MYFSFDGIPGCGKHDVMRDVSIRLTDLGFSVRVLNDPINESIRAITNFLPDNSSLPTVSKVLLAMIDRVDVQNLVMSYEEEIVITDGCVLRDYASLGVAEGYGVGNIQALHDFLCIDRKPDLCFFVDEEPIEANLRLFPTGSINAIPFLTKARFAYLESIKHAEFDVLVVSDPSVITSRILMSISEHEGLYSNLSELALFDA